MEEPEVPSYKFLENIVMKRGEQKIIGKVIQLWEVNNPKNGNEIISLNFLLPDDG